MRKYKTVMLVILDGFGIREDKYYNGILNANMINYFSYWNEYPHTKLNASGPLVGLPEGQIGSSEVGHMTMGAGRLIKQAIVRINEEIENGKFFENKKLNEGLEFANKNRGNIHLIGLLGPGGVHSNSKHLYAILDFYDRNIDKITGNIYLHNFLDGRDTPQSSAIGYLDGLSNKISKLKNKNKFILASICGRYYAMDRDKRWERTQKAYELLIYGKGKKFENYKTAIEESYKNKEYDEFVKPVIFHTKEIKDNDLCMFYNFRSDRPRQIIEAITNKNFEEFETKKYNNLKFQTLTEYSPKFDVDVLYPTIFPQNTLGEILSQNNLKQLRIAESEKFPHITYFFNGLNNVPFLGEKQIKINSPKVATYDLKPEMSAEEVTQVVCEEIEKKIYDFILLNFANSDMVGHTGDFEAVKKALKTVDICLEKIKKTLESNNGLLMLTADHGNCETMRDENDKPHTKHTYNQVPFIICDKTFKLRKDYDKLSLFNIAPSILEILEVEKSKEMEKSIFNN
ncbi:MAG: 2,3-bisphosphoglycerate-independent phosphoglycerate mutase [Nanoarchaeota archaeon]|nr:2,3-bisphosphoglycerate-independent phosphoglycerate mutase [Nanoarchaeota archaeon]